MIAYELGKAPVHEIVIRSYFYASLPLGIRGDSHLKNPICSRWRLTPTLPTVVARPGNFPRPADNSLQDAANSLLVSINSLFCAIKFPVPISRELSSNKLILLRSDGPPFAKRPDFHEIPGIMAQLPQARLEVRANVEKGG